MEVDTSDDLDLDSRGDAWSAVAVDRGGTLASAEVLGDTEARGAERGQQHSKGRPAGVAGPVARFGERHDHAEVLGLGVAANVVEVVVVQEGVHELLVHLAV